MFDISIPLEKTLLGRSFRTAHLKIVQGFPASKNKSRSIDHLNSMVFVTSLTTGHEIEEDVDFLKFGKEKDKHFALQWKKIKKSNQPPSPKGLSGGPFWIIPNSLEPTVAYLAGVFIERHERAEVAFVTKISQVIDLIDSFQ